MSASSRPEVWLRGPLPGIDPVLMPAAHTLIQAREDIAEARAGIDRALVQLERTPPATYGEMRAVGRAEVPATVLGLIVHAAEQTSRAEP